jgi:HTH-type transcriptional regulator/antitoxin HigA
MKIRTEEEFHAFRVEMEKLVAKGTTLGDIELLNKEDKSRYVMLSQAISRWETAYYPIRRSIYLDCPTNASVKR